MEGPSFDPMPIRWVGLQFAPPDQVLPIKGRKIVRLAVVGCGYVGMKSLGFEYHSFGRLNPSTTSDLVCA